MYINVQYVRMPSGVHGATVLNDDGGFTVFIDPNDPPDVQMKGYIHEKNHIDNGDFDNIYDKQARAVEERAHKKRRA